MRKLFLLLFLFLAIPNVCSSTDDYYFIVNKAKIVAELQNSYINESNGNVELDNIIYSYVTEPYSWFSYEGCWYFLGICDTDYNKVSWGCFSDNKIIAFVTGRFDEPTGKFFITEMLYFEESKNILDTISKDSMGEEELGGV